VSDQRAANGWVKAGVKKGEDKRPNFQPIKIKLCQESAVKAFVNFDDPVKKITDKLKNKKT
jgi:hypothetical protein